MRKRSETDGGLGIVVGALVLVVAAGIAVVTREPIVMIGPAVVLVGIWGCRRQGFGGFVLAGILALGLAFGAIVPSSASDPRPITVRWCPEDAVHVGRGDFDGTRWTSYRCIARDDLEGMMPSDR